MGSSLGVLMVCDDDFWSLWSLLVYFIGVKMFNINKLANNVFVVRMCVLQLKRMPIRAIFLLTESIFFDAIPRLCCS